MELQLESPKPSSIKLAVGLFFTALGVLLTLENLDIVDAGRVLRYWPVMLIVLGVLNLREPGRKGLAILSIAAGSLLTATRALSFRFSIFDFWPLILIIAGGVIVMRALGVSGPVTAGGATYWSVLTTRKQTVHPANLHGRSVVAFMSGSQLELTGAGDSKEPVIVEVLSVWGGVELRVPPGYEVVGEVVPIMGGIDIKADSTPGGRPLIVRGLVLMAGMEVKNARQS